MNERGKTWLVVSGNRFHLATVILGFMVGIAFLPTVGTHVIRNPNPLYYLGSGLITGNVTLITVVVAINQVILSQELESPGSLRDEIERTAEFRRSSLDGPVESTDPSAFLGQLVRQTRQHARELEDTLPADAETADDLLLTTLPAHCDAVDSAMERATDDVFDAIRPTLDADYAEYVHECHRRRAIAEGADADETGERRRRKALDQLAADLENLDVARQYFTTTFVKEELATLSRSLLYIGVLSVSVPVALLVHLSTQTAVTVPGADVLVLVVLAAIFGLAPLALLIATILRIATVAEYIASITPFSA